MTNSGDPIAPENLRRQTVPFAEIPGQTRLFLDYLSDPLALKRFFPGAVASYRDLPSRAPEVLRHYDTDRTRLCDALAAMNLNWNAAGQTLENIEKLRSADCVAVVTGQQAGLFSGALYTVYKAVSIIKVAAYLNQQNIRAVPIFWIASEDHDFAEVAATEIINREGFLTKLELTEKPNIEGLAVGKVRVGESINQTIDKLLASLPETEFSVDLQELVRASYQPQFSLSEAFARLMTKLFGRLGLILLDPLDAELKRLAAPIYARAIECSGEMTAAMIARSRELENANYHAQVLVKEDSFPLFWNDENGKRCALHRTKKGTLTTKCTRHNFSQTDLIEIANSTPERLSPNVTLRSAVQDYLLPTVCYFGGAAEIAYFAQSSEVYRILKRPATPIIHRASVTIVEREAEQTLQEFDLRFTDLLTKQECWLPRIVGEFLNPATARVFAETEEQIFVGLDALEKSLLGFDVTLANSAVRRRERIERHLNQMREKFYDAEINRHAAVKNRLAATCAALFPHKSLQERSLNFASLLARHQDCLREKLWQAIDIDTVEHQIIFL